MLIHLQQSMTRFLDYLIVFLALCILQSTVNAFELPIECSLTPDQYGSSSTTPTGQNPSPAPTNSPSNSSTAHPTATPTFSPTHPWDIACCNAITSQYFYRSGDPTSTCGASMGSGYIA